MFEKPAEQDIDYALSMLMHEARRQVADENNRVKSDAAKHGALQSNRVIVIIADAADKIHAASLTQARRMLIDFVQRMERPASEITAWARPHLENLSNVVLGGIPPNGFPNDHQRIIRQYQAVFQQRIEGTLREVKIGYVRGAGFSAQAAMSDKEEWISAASALALLGIDHLAGTRTICKRAHAGLIKARAERFIRDGRSANNVDLPDEFWWAEGGAALHQNWTTGDFDTWIDKRVHLEAFGVSFLQSDIEKIALPRLTTHSRALNAPVAAENCRSAIILTALEVETRATIRHLTDLHEQSVRGGTVFHVGQFGQWVVAVAECGDGNVRAAATVERGINYFHPEVALFLGVAGGVKDVTIGDVVVSSKVYGYERGKEGEGGFRPRPTVNLPDYALEQRARAVRLKDDWQQRLNPKLQHSKPRIHVGAIAAGEKVVASSAGTIAQFLKEQYGDTLAVEMEGQGFLAGVHINAPVQGCVIRGISDLLDGKAEADKSGFQVRAADVASAVAFEMLATLERQTKARLVTDIANAPRPILAPDAVTEPLPRPPIPEPFQAAASRQGPSRFRAAGEPIGISDGLIGGGEPIHLAAGPAMWFRLMPLHRSSRTYSATQLRELVRRQAPFPIGSQSYNSWGFLRADDGFGFFAIESTTATRVQTPAMVFVFENGELWAINSKIISCMREVPYFPNEFTGQLDRLVSFLRDQLKVSRPYRWIAGIEGVNGRPLVAGQTFAGFVTGHCVADVITENGMYVEGESGATALRPFFVKILEKCGVDVANMGRLLPATA